MSRTLLVASFLSAALAAQTGAEIPGISATLVADRSVVSAGGNAVIRLLIDVKADTEVPGDLLTGLNLAVRVGDEPAADKPTATVQDAGKGGKVALAGGTKIERTLTVPVARLCPAAGGADFKTIAVQWPGISGANCVLKVAPDTSKMKIEDIDLAKVRCILVTNHGEITLAFYSDKAPETAKNFVKLAMSGFYDGTKFHRVIRNFMIQGGDPLTKDDSQEGRWGTGDAGYKIKGEVNDTQHVRGVVSMANSGHPDTAGSQFFICHKDAAHLNRPPGYTAFGAVEKGLDVLDAIANVQCGGPEGSKPVKPVHLHQVIVVPGK
jgi:peptidyl-prolyl cis-trans isomerase B (cyclophilin B)